MSDIYDFPAEINDLDAPLPRYNEPRQISQQRFYTTLGTLLNEGKVSVKDTNKLIHCVEYLRLQVKEKKNGSILLSDPFEEWTEKNDIKLGDIESPIEIIIEAFKSIAYMEDDLPYPNSKVLLSMFKKAQKLLDHWFMVEKIYNEDRIDDFNQYVLYFHQKMFPTIYIPEP